jgi:hypothetical protein
VRRRESGESGTHADVTLETDPQTFAGLLTKHLRVEDAVCAGTLNVVGRPELAERLFACLSIPTPGSVGGGAD